MRPLVLFGWSALGYTPSGRLGDAAPVEGGCDLYRMLSAQWRTVLLYTGLDTSEMAEMWVRREGLRSHVGMFCMEDHTADPVTWKLQQLRKVRTEGNRDLLFVDSDPRSVALAIRDGVPAMLLAFPTYISPDWRPDADTTPRPWDALEQEIDLQREGRNA